MEIPPVTLAGFFGYGNAGDEMILSLLRRRLDPILFLSGPRPVGPGSVRRFHLPSVWRALGRSRALVVGGGELFQTRTSVRSLVYYVTLPWLARRRGRPVMVFGAALDPSLGKLGQRFVAMALRGAQCLWVRDETSARFLAANGVTAWLMPDVVWAWPRPTGTVPKDLRRILWVLRFPRTGGDGFFPLGGTSWPGVWDHGILALDPTEDAEGVGRFRSMTPFFTRLERWSQPDDLLSVMGRYDLVVTMRYHGLVCAALAGRPALAIPSHGKVQDLADELGVSTVCPWVGVVNWPSVLYNAFLKGPPEVGERPNQARLALDDLAHQIENACTVRSAK
ncbi:MAG: polysaccharide pyruvyl transferase family protein [Elusimicrobia bacterium]|nr:polysaccharide pyruvyl transferase family protein [Elusimicrobiota bacterium]